MTDLSVSLLCVRWTLRRASSKSARSRGCSEFWCYSQAPGLKTVIEHLPHERFSSAY